jgi:proteasome lid subunit RPN8/RPN11
MVIKVKKDLQKRIETFLHTWPSTEEYGGFLFSNRIGNISEFLVIPNVHDSRTNTYQMPLTAKALAEKFASARKLKVVAHWHNHPTPCVCSEQDCRAASYWEPLWSVMISPTESGRYKKEFIWYFYKGIKPEKVTFI